jgi:uncharacterized membrane protein YuzA (DUF378 family)
MWILDFPSLILIIAAGFQLGILGLFGWDAAAAIFGTYAKDVYIAAGVAAIWQLFRQRFH